MVSNFCEEMEMQSDIGTFHEELLQKMSVPTWMNLKCPFCNKQLPLRSIRSFGVKLNTRNLGDLVVEILCTDCGQMDTLYFKQEIERVTDFIEFLNGSKRPKNPAVLEEDMYKAQYNNVLDKMNKRS